MFKYKIFCEKNFKIGVFQCCGCACKDSKFCLLETVAPLVVNKESSVCLPCLHRRDTLHWTCIWANSEFGRKIAFYFPTKLTVNSNSSLMGNLYMHRCSRGRHQSWKFFHRISCIYAGNIIRAVRISFAKTLVSHSLMNVPKSKRSVQKIFLPLSSPKS